MKTLVAGVDERYGRVVSETSAPYLLRGLGGAAIDVRSETLDLAMELLRRFGAVPKVASRLHAPFLGAFVAQREHDSACTQAGSGSDWNPRTCT